MLLPAVSAFIDAMPIQRGFILCILMVMIVCLAEGLLACSPAQAGQGNASQDSKRAGSSLRVSANGRYLVHRNGKPFFWLGDTAWLLFQIPTREEADLYLKTRARQGFTVIQAAIVMGEERVGGTLTPNAYGDKAFIEGDPARPAIKPGQSPRNRADYDYWDHADYVISRARAHGLTLGLLPLFVGYNGDGYKYLTPRNAESYGLFLGKRYRHQPHLLWILGGDNTPDTEEKRSVWNAVARGIAVGVSGSEDYGRVLMTYHINGNNSSSQWLHQAPWLDFNMIQVWGQEEGIYPKISQDYALTPVRPTGLGEGSYENGTQYSTRPINALKIRQQACWSYLAGGYHTYGNTDTWNFSSYRPEGTEDWKTALHSPGARHLSALARFFKSLRWWELEPASELLSGGKHPAAMRSVKGDYLLAYLSDTSPFTLRLEGLTGPARAAWVDPQTGKRATAAGRWQPGGEQTLTPPAGWQDALLLVETTPEGAKRR